MIAAAGWIFLAVNLLSPERTYQSDSYTTLVKCETAAAALREMRPTFAILPPGLGMICVPTEVLMTDRSIVRLPDW